MKPWLRRGLWVAASLGILGVLWFFSTSRGSYYFVHLLEWSYQPILPENCPAGDAIAVLAGTGLPRNHPLRSFETPNRMDGALALYNAVRAPLLVLTTEEGELNRLAAIARGIPADRILLAGPADNTAGEIRLIADVARLRNWHRLLLVTSSFHMRRSVLLLQRAMEARNHRLAVVPYPVDWQQIPAVPAGHDPCVPNRYGLELLKKTLKEMAEIIFYSL